MAFPNLKIPQTKMVTKVTSFVWLGMCIHKNIVWDQTRIWGLHNHKNNKCDVIGHYFSFSATTGLLVINSISPNNKNKHQVQPIRD
jgi:hypothetical protein